VAGVGHVGVDLGDVSLVFGGLRNDSRNVRDRGHGKCVSGPWEPGSPGCA
jgi:hypothetical protein